MRQLGNSFTVFIPFLSRYINAAQNKLERLPVPGDPFEEDLEGRKKKKITRTCYTAPALQELYLQVRVEPKEPEVFFHNMKINFCLVFNKN